jgi:hypothetical protein
MFQGGSGAVFEYPSVDDTLAAAGSVAAHTVQYAAAMRARDGAQRRADIGCAGAQERVVAIAGMICGFHTHYS